MNPPVDRIVVCPYCGEYAKLVTGLQLYGARRCNPKYEKKWFWSCTDCLAWVGTHPGSRDMAPLGTLADLETRRARMAAHEAFDPIHRSGMLTRPMAYAWLANALGITPRRCHIGMMKPHECEEVVRVCAQFHDRFLACIEEWYGPIEVEEQGGLQTEDDAAIHA